MDIFQLSAPHLLADPSLRQGEEGEATGSPATTITPWRRWIPLGAAGEIRQRRRRWPAPEST
ncbi:MAG: hypothetical protein ACK6BG_00955 [Cyanobacteriota bacterium]